MTNQEFDLRKYTKLNLACGPIKENHFPEPWLNVDVKSPIADLQMDVRELPKEWEEKFWEVRASHVLEHFYIEEWPLVLEEWLRVLKPGGILRLALPDLKVILENLAKPDKRGLKGRETLSLTKPTAALTQLYGIGYDKADTEKRWRHRIVTDSETLINYLTETKKFEFVKQIPKQEDVAAFHGIKDDSQNSWSMSIVAKKKSSKNESLPDVMQDEYVLSKSADLPHGANITAACGLVTNQFGQLLAIKNKRGWDIPGGHLESGESPEEALEREVYEEASTRIASPALFLTASTPDDSPVPYSMVFYAAKSGEFDQFDAVHETTQREYFLPQELLALYGGGKPELMVEVLRAWQTLQ